MFGYVPQAVGTGYLVVLVGLLAGRCAVPANRCSPWPPRWWRSASPNYLLLPTAAVAAIPYAVAARRRLRRRRLFTAVVALVAVPLAVLPRRVNSGDHPLDLLLQRFAIVRPDRSTILALGLLVLAGGWLGRGWWRTHAMRTAAVAVAGAGAFAAVVAAVSMPTEPVGGSV